MFGGRVVAGAVLGRGGPLEMERDEGALVRLGWGRTDAIRGWEWEWE